jgi:RNA polymerase sigma-70 factor (ECF subfamily)
MGLAIDLSGYAPVLRRYFLKRVAAKEIDDLTQEVFLNMHARRTEARIENIQSYVFSVAAHVLARHRARRCSERISYSEADQAKVHGPQVPSAEDEAISREGLQRLVATLESLPARSRNVFVLHRFEDMSYQAIACQLRISVSAIEKHIMNALKAMRMQRETYDR